MKPSLPSRGVASIALLLSATGCGGDGPSSDGSPGDDPGAPTGGPAWFVDVAAECGLDFVHENGATGDYQLPEIMGPGCAWLDHDGDGDFDLYVVNSGPDPARAGNRLFRNDRADGGVTFVDVTAESGTGCDRNGMGCTVGDYDGDGLPDIYVTNFGANRLYRNRGDGTFEDTTVTAGVGDERWGASCAFVDVDGDGRLDLYVANYMVHPPVATDRCFDGAGRVEYCGPNSHFEPERDTLYRNLGDGTFEDVTEDAGISEVRGNGLGVVCADFDGDGRVDLYVANDATANHLWINQGRARFVDKGVEWGAAFNQLGRAEAGMGVVAEDVDGDGHLDLFVTHFVKETNTLYRGDGRGRFSDVTFRSGLGPPSRDRTAFGVALFDADHDGDLDLAIANGRVIRAKTVDGVRFEGLMKPYAENDQFFEHVAPTGGGRDAGPWGFTFVEKSASVGAAFRTPDLGRALAPCDFDGDGDVDLAITCCGGRLRLLRNEAPKRGSWLLVSALDDQGGHAYGATVTVVAGDRRWTRTVQPCSSYFTATDPRVHFGLGAAETASVSVRWPNGDVTELPAGPVDRAITVRREEG